jgi:outer membrane protein assembly factor BamB
MRTGLNIGFCALMILLGSPTFLNAADWPVWRGPQRDGICREAGLLKEWPEGGPKLVWKSTGLGEGYSTVSVAGNRIYTAGETGAVSSVICLDATTGKQVWNAKLGKPGAPGWGGFAGPRATPTVDGDLVYTVDQWGEIMCLEAGSGKELWRKSFTSDFGAKRPEWGFSESPLVDGDKVVVTPGGSKGTVVALNKKTGAVIWQSRDFTDPAHYSSIVLAEIAGAKQYVQLTASHVAGFGTGNGAVLWKAERSGRTAVIPTPICSENFVYVTSGYGAGCNLFRITAENGGFKAEEVYSNKHMINHHGGVVKMGDHVYGYSDGKGWTCQDFKTGEVKWQDKEKLGKGSVLGVGSDRLVLRQEDKTGTVVLLEATPKGWQEHGRFNQPDRSGKHSWPHPVIANGRLYLRDQDILLCYDVKAP